jgi:hypothetical protein
MIIAHRRPCTQNHANRLVHPADPRSVCRKCQALVVDNAAPTNARADRPQRLRGGKAGRPRGKARLSNARNRAIREARGEYLVFLDDDETPDPDWLRAFETLIEIGAPDAFGGRIEVLFEGERPAWLADELGFRDSECAESIVPLTRPDTSFQWRNFASKSVWECAGP